MIPDNVEQITCIKLGPNKRFLHIGEKHKDDPGCYLTVYDLNEACPVPYKQHNVSMLADGRGNTIVNGISQNFGSSAGNAMQAAVGNLTDLAASQNPIADAAAAAMSSAMGMSTLNPGANNANKSTKPRTIVDINFKRFKDNNLLPHVTENANLMVIAMTDETDSRVVVFDWSLGRIIATAEWKRVLIDRVSFNPTDPREVCVSGHNIF